MQKPTSKKGKGTIKGRKESLISPGHVPKIEE